MNPDIKTIAQEMKDLKIFLNEKFVENAKDHKEIKDDIKDYACRVQALERWRWFIMGAVAVLTALILPIVVPMAIKLLSKI